MYARDRKRVISYERSIIQTDNRLLCITKLEIPSKKATQLLYFIFQLFICIQ